MVWIIDEGRFQCLGMAQPNDLSPKVFLVLTFGGVNKTPDSWLRRKLYFDGNETWIKWHK